MRWTESSIFDKIMTLFKACTILTKQFMYLTDHFDSIDGLAARDFWRNFKELCSLSTKSSNAKAEKQSFSWNNEQPAWLSQLFRSNRMTTAEEVAWIPDIKVFQDYRLSWRWASLFQNPFVNIKRIRTCGHSHFIRIWKSNAKDAQKGTRLLTMPKHLAYRSSQTFAIEITSNDVSMTNCCNGKCSVTK